MKLKIKLPFFNKNEEKGKGKLQISDNIVNIEVLRVLGKNVYYSILKFEATQEKDPANNNLVLVNKEQNFKDDIEFVRMRVLDSLLYAFNQSNSPKEEKLDHIDKKIKEQRIRIESISEGYILVDGKKIPVNKYDEEIKLKYLKTLRDIVEFDGRGSYEIVDIDGRRKIYYSYRDGVLYPMKWVADNNVVLEDTASKRKIYSSDQTVLDQEYLAESRTFFSGWKGYVTLAVILIWTIALIYWSTKLYEGYQAWDESNINDLIMKAEGSAINCAYWFATIGEETATFINATQQINEQKETNNKAVSVG